MATQPLEKPTWPTTEFFANRDRFWADQMARYRGQYVAWSYDGTHIVASAADEAQLFEKLKAEGYDLSRTLIDFSDES